MQQHRLPLYDDDSDLAGTMPAMRAAMRRTVGGADSEGRKLLVDSINAQARHHEIRLTLGNNKLISKDTLDKWVSPSDNSHPPSILATVVFCRASKNISPLLVILLTLGRGLATELIKSAAARLGLGIMDEADRLDMEYGRACRMEREARQKKKRLEEKL